MLTDGRRRLISEMRDISGVTDEKQSVQDLKSCFNAHQRCTVQELTWQYLNVMGGSDECYCCQCSATSNCALK